MLDGGTWGEHAVVSSSWIEEALAPRTPIDPHTVFGYLWWLRGFPTEAGPQLGTYMSGNGGNLVVVLGGLDAVVVVQSAAYNEPDAGARSFALVQTAIAELSP